MLTWKKSLALCLALLFTISLSACDYQFLEENEKAGGARNEKDSIFHPPWVGWSGYC